MDLLQNEYKSLSSKKDEIEGTIADLMDLLESNKNVGMNEPLIDSEGFPRSDIDVYSVRHARHQIACLQNDHKDIMKQIEQKLYDIHECARTNATVQNNQASSVEKPVLKPFLSINQLAAGGPADQAGIKIGDVVKQFGSITKDNYKSLQDIGIVVQHSKDKVIKLVVERDGKDYRLELTPHTWSGRGLLGCNVIEMKP